MEKSQFKRVGALKQVIAFIPLILVCAIQFFVDEWFGVVFLVTLALALLFNLFIIIKFYDLFVELYSLAQEFVDAQVVKSAVYLLGVMSLIMSATEHYYMASYFVLLVIHCVVMAKLKPHFKNKHADLL